jgi:hypothetical protein
MSDRFDEQYEEAKLRNRLFTWEEKKGLFRLLTKDWGDGRGKQPYKPHKYQIEAHKSKARVKVMVAGNRGGKSLFAAVEGAIALTRFNARIWVIGETYDICDREWAYIQYFVTKSDLWHKRIKPEIERQMEEADLTGSASSYIHVKNNHPKRIEIDWPCQEKSFIRQRQFGRLTEGGTAIEGEELTGIIWSEGARIPKPLVEQHLNKRLADRWGWMILAVTAKGKDEFLSECYHRGAEYTIDVDIDRMAQKVNYEKKPVEKTRFHVDNTDSYWDSYFTVHFPAFESPHYNMETYNADRRALFEGTLDESVFKERNFGTFESMSGVFYQGLDWDMVLTHSHSFPENATYYRSLDPGFAGAFCCLFMYVDDSGNYVVYNEIYKDHVHLEAFIPKILDATEHNIEFTTGDPATKRHTHHHKDATSVRIRDLGIVPYYLPNNLPRNTVSRLNHWKPYLYDYKLEIWEDKCPNLVREMKILEWGEQTYQSGHSTRSQKLAKSPMHALDCLTYLFYMYPKYEPPAEKKKKHVPNGSVFDWDDDHPHPNSFKAGLMEQRKNKRKAKIGVW